MRESSHRAARPECIVGSSRELMHHGCPSPLPSPPCTTTITTTTTLRPHGPRMQLALCFCQDCRTAGHCKYWYFFLQKYLSPVILCLINRVLKTKVHDCLWLLLFRYSAINRNVKDDINSVYSYNKPSLI